MTGNDLRQKYLDYFKNKQHAIVPSASLVPDNDPTTLFTGSGMQPMLPYLLGESHPQGTRIADSQRCFRVQDIEEVGDNRHTTVFEMLGNWSLGDYFKAEQLPWMFDFLTKDVGLDPHKLYVSVFAGSDGVARDDQAIQIWQDLYSTAGIEAKVVDDAEQNGMQGGRIFSYGAKKNWWSRSGVPEKMPVGEPGGPDSEIFYDFGEELGLHSSEFGTHCHPNCDCGRYLEIGNNVFMQYQKQADGSFKELPQKNIDFGGGLERVLAAKLDTPDVFKTDLFWPIIECLEQISGVKYESNTASFRIIADHIKAAVWLASDGVIPSNKAQGYVLRRVIRRAIGQARKLGIEVDFVSEVAKVIQKMYASAYPNVTSEGIIEILAAEEEQFSRTIVKGLHEMRKAISQPVFDGKLTAIQNTLESIAPNDRGVYLPFGRDASQIAFDLYQTHGVPVDMFVDELATKFTGVVYPIEYQQDIKDEFQKLLEEHQAKSRQGSSGMFKGGLGGDSFKEVQYHTATHLLQQALRDVLGDTVAQRGSNITPERLRFDFTAESRLTPEQKQQVEDIVNQKIAQALPVTFAILPLDQARQSGAIGLFGEKYGDTVKVYSIGGPQQSPEGRHPEVSPKDLSQPNEILRSAQNDQGQTQLAQQVEVVDPRDQVYSREFCGGPHLANTSLIEGKFVIQKDEKISRDVVRIKAVLE